MKKFALIAVLAALCTGAVGVQAKQDVSAVAAKALVGVPAPEVPGNGGESNEGSPEGQSCRGGERACSQRCEVESGGLACGGRGRGESGSVDGRGCGFGWLRV